MIVRAISALAYNLYLNVVAEGVDDESEFVQVQAMECACAQGQVFSWPVCASEATRLLDGGLVLPGLRAV
jgi:EAL domain-containing protein (putative c-di-GMP-specific phosphodiesterase class I)